MSRTKWTVRRTSNPTALAVSVADLKKHLNIAAADTTQDDKIETLSYAAQERLEKDTGGRQIISATYLYEACEFGDSISLPIRPVTAVSSVQYYDTDKVLQTLDASDYTFDQSRREVRPSIGNTFPTVYDDPSAVKVSFTAGYGASEASVPRMVKAAIMLSVGKMFYDPAQEASALHSQETAYLNLVRLLMSTEVPY